MIETALRPFQPKADLPEWRLIYDRLLAQADFGDIITYAELDEVLGREFIDNRTPLYKARARMAEDRNRWVESEPGVGYRVIEANEHIRVAGGRRKRAQQQMKQMMRITNGTDLARLTPSELEMYDVKSRLFATQFVVLMHEKRLRRIEGVLQANGLI